MMFTVSASHWA